MIAHIFSRLVRFCLFLSLSLSCFIATPIASDAFHLSNGEAEDQIDGNHWLLQQDLDAVVDTNSEKLFFHKVSFHLDHSFQLFSCSDLIRVVDQENVDRATNLSVLSFKLFPRPPPSLFSC
ncbi:MAG: hypothetical protein V1767_09730 [Chloroflexota bacterium]